MMVNPGAFVGSRVEFLKGEKRAYAEAVASGYARDTLSTISRRYFKRYPVDLPHNEEPTAEHLASVDDDAICPDEPPLDPNDMPVDDYLAEKLRREKAAELVDYRQGVSFALFVLEVIDPSLANQTLDGIPIYEGPRHQPQGYGRA